jgi:hypothetical protein
VKVAFIICIPGKWRLWFLRGPYVDVLRNYDGLSDDKITAMMNVSRIMKDVG